MKGEKLQPAVAGRLSGKCAVVIGLSRFLADDIAATLRGAGAEVVVDDVSRLPEAVSFSDAGSVERQVLDLWNIPLAFLLLLGSR